MEALSVRHEIDIDAPIERVWSFVGTAAGLRAWWGVDVTLDERVGGHYEERGTHGTLSYHLVGQVVTYDPPHTIAYTLRERLTDSREWPADTTVTITLTETAGRTHVTLIHSGFERLPADYAAHKRQGFDRGWTRELSTLPDVVRASVPV